MSNTVTKIRIMHFVNKVVSLCLTSKTKHPLYFNLLTPTVDAESLYVPTLWPYLSLIWPLLMIVYSIYVSLVGRRRHRYGDPYR